MTTKAQLIEFVEELYPVLLDRVQETKDVLSGLATFLSDPEPLTRDRIQKPDQMPETDQAVREKGDQLKPLVPDLIPAFESMYESILGLAAEQGGEPANYSATKNEIETAFNDYDEAHNDVVEHLRETVIVKGISEQPDILGNFSDTSDELSDRPEQAREYADGNIPESLKNTAIALIDDLETQIGTTISIWENI